MHRPAPDPLNAPQRFAAQLQDLQHPGQPENELPNRLIDALQARYGGGANQDLAQRRFGQARAHLEARLPDRAHNLNRPNLDELEQRTARARNQLEVQQRLLRQELDAQEQRLQALRQQRPDIAPRHHNHPYRHVVPPAAIGPAALHDPPGNPHNVRPQYPQLLNPPHNIEVGGQRPYRYHHPHHNRQY